MSLTKGKFLIDQKPITSASLGISAGLGNQLSGLCYVFAVITNSEDTRHSSGR
jgi:hypothetical protein